MKNIHFKKYPRICGLALLMSLALMARSHGESIAPRVHAVSSENPVPGRGAKNTVNGSGLSHQFHAAGANDTAWTSLGNLGATDYDPFITYDLGAVRDVESIHVWNYNSNYKIKLKTENSGELSTLQKTMTVIGPDKMEVFTSADGKNYQSRGLVQFAIATGKPGYAGQKIKVDYKGVRFIKFDIKTTHEGTVFDGTGKNKGKIDGRALTGLSEVRFGSPGMVEYKVAENGLNLKEGGTAAEYVIRLAKKPKSGKAVYVHAVPSDSTLIMGGQKAGEAVVIKFTQSNWNQWQKVTVKANDDNIPTVNHLTKIRHFTSKGSATGPAAQMNDIKVRITDNDSEPKAAALKPIAADKRMEWFRDIKYYWFIHWGPSSLTGAEISWSRNAHNKKTYDQLYKKFNPVDYDADEWVRLAKAGGLKTIVLTAKHHDGFCMWDTKTTDYNIMNTPFKRDVIKELSEACKRHGLRFSLYYSIMDWYHPDWPVHYAGGPGYKLPAGQKPDIDRYLDYMERQLEELFTKYGDVSLMWWDGTDGRDAFAPNSVWGDKQIVRFEKLCRKLQPAMVMSNRIGRWDGNDISKDWWLDKYGDYDSNEMERMQFEEHKPWEYTWKLGNQWAYRPNDVYKSTATMLRDYIIKIVGNNGNFLMDVSPGPSGKFEKRVVDRLTDIGNWLKLHGESIYETRGGPYVPGASNWGVATRKGNKAYLHILNWPAGKLTLPPLGKKVVSSSLLTGGTVNVKQTATGLSIDVPIQYRKKIATVIVLELEGSAMDIKPIKTK